MFRKKASNTTKSIISMGEMKKENFFLPRKEILASHFPSNETTQEIRM